MIRALMILVGIPLATLGASHVAAGDPVGWAGLVLGLALILGPLGQRFTKPPADRSGNDY